MPVYTDQVSRTIEIPLSPKRIISLVPSQTELLHDLGLTNEVIGITKFCVHPESWFRTKERIGGTKNTNLEKISLLKPDLILANREENVKEQVDALASKFPVWVSDINNLEDACQMIKSVGEITGRQPAAKTMVADIQSAFASLSSQSTLRKTAYLIWKNPYMTIGGDTFIHDLLSRSGFENVFGDRKRYPEVTIQDIQQSGCELLFLSSEPYPFKQKHITELQEQLPNMQIVLVDGEMFSWYGSRLLHAAGYFQHLHQQINALV